VGVESAIHAENNHFRVPEAVTSDLFVDRFNGAAIHASGTYRNGVTASSEVDVAAAYNALNTPVLGTDVGWTPILHGEIEATATVPVSVAQGAGPFK
jgi:pectate lyase